jgi:hypothetical protein
LCEKGFPGQNVAIGFKLSLSQDTIVCFDALESVPHNLFQSAILADVGEKIPRKKKLLINFKFTLCFRGCCLLKKGDGNEIVDVVTLTQ